MRILNFKFKIKNLAAKIFMGYSVLEECESPINGKIEVVETLFNKRRLIVGGLTQSGDLVEEIWEKALARISNSKYQISNILILGLGAGTVANLINQILPDSYITGVEIDEVIVGLGKKYFGLNKVQNLEIIIDDVFSIINHESSIINHYDLILVDLYLGDKIPKELDSEKFFKGIKQKLNKNGLVIFNRLNYKEKKIKNDEFKNILQNEFNNVEDLSFRSNRFFFCFN